MAELMIEKSFFGKLPLSQEKKVIEEIYEDYVFDVYPKVAYPFLLTDREEVVRMLKSIKGRLEEVGV
jgi:hypothetical protein